MASDARIQDKQCMVFAGTVVSNGRATAVVTATGGVSEIGRIQQGVSAARLDEEKTPLAQKLDHFGNVLTLGIGAICLVVWLLSIPKFSQPAFGGWWRGALYYLKVATTHYYSLPTTTHYYSLLTARYSLLTTYHVLTAHCLLLTTTSRWPWRWVWPPSLRGYPYPYP